ncbi:MAG: NAD(P)H-hydrate dehydratase [Patescibacteria group bacterium]
MPQVNKSVFKKIYQPKSNSKKGDNGILTIIGGSKKYHGAPQYSILAASHFVDLVYSNAILSKKIPEYIFGPNFKKSDALLIGPGLGISQKTKNLVNNLTQKYSNKKIILDADALKVVDKKILKKYGKNIILTPHAGEFKILFNLPGNQENVHKMCKEYGCIVVLKGKKDIVCDKKICYYNNIGNPGMTKGGTGDVLAGLIAALACKNDLLDAALMGTLLNGLAANDLKKTHGLYFNATELASQLPKTLNKYIK